MDGSAEAGCSYKRPVIAGCSYSQCNNIISHAVQVISFITCKTRMTSFHTQRMVRFAKSRGLTDELPEIDRVAHLSALPVSSRLRPAGHAAVRWTVSEPRARV